MPVLFFSEYRPDVSDYEGNSSQDITNVVPRGDGYGPFPGFSAFTAALPNTCFGSFAARKNDGSIAIFAGTSNKLYMLSNTSGTWTDVSRSGGTYSALASGAIWKFAQFNNFVFATQVNDNLQIFDLTSATAFADRADSNCPAAAYITVVNSFLVLSGIASPNVYRVQWSGLNDVSSSQAFTPGINSADFQDLADGGIVHGVSGGEYGVIFQDTSLRRLLYSPGAPFVFQIDRIAVDDGLLTPYSLVQSGNNVFWLGPFGFKMLAPGGLPTPIGKERVDRTFLADCDFTHPELLQGSNDPTHTRVLWAYKSKGNSLNTADKVLVYDWALDRWTVVTGGGYGGGVVTLTPLAQPSLSLEGVDAAFGTGTPVQITALTTAATGSVFTANQPITLTAGRGVILTVSATSTTTLPAAVIPATPYYVTASNLTTSAFSLTTSGGIGTAITTSGSTTLITMAATAGTSALFYAVESIESLNLGSLDNISNVSQITLAAVSTANVFGFFTGANLQATLETPEQGGDGKRIFNRGFRVVSDATTGSILGSASYRATPQSTYNYTAEQAVNAIGVVPLRVSTRYTRNKIRIPQATTWTYAAGVEADNAPDGTR
jgi:hypothetical protein